MSRPAFNSLWKGDWPYKDWEGVGLHLIGVPNDEYKFIACMMGYSCHPSAGKRIVDRLKQHGEDRLTVMSRLNFDEIAIRMKEFGITMTIIPPQPGWEPRFPKEPWPSDYIKELMK